MKRFVVIEGAHGEESMKKIFIFFLTSLFCLSAYSAEEADFFNAAPSLMWELLSYDEVFYDELLEEKIYKVSFTYVVIEDCASAGEVDFCGPADDKNALAEDCLYFTETPADGLQPTDITCDQDISLVVGESGLIDEY